MLYIGFGIIVDLNGFIFCCADSSVLCISLDLSDASVLVVQLNVFYVKMAGNLCWNMKIV